MCGLLDPDPLKKYKREVLDRISIARRQTELGQEYSKKFLGTPGQEIAGTLQDAWQDLIKAKAQVEEDPPGVRAKSKPNVDFRVSGATRRRVKHQRERSLKVHRVRVRR